MTVDALFSLSLVASAANEIGVSRASCTRSRWPSDGGVWSAPRIDRRLNCRRRRDARRRKSRRFVAVVSITTRVVSVERATVERRTACASRKATSAFTRFVNAGTFCGARARASLIVCRLRLNLTHCVVVCRNFLVARAFAPFPMTSAVVATAAIDFRPPISTTRAATTSRRPTSTLCSNPISLFSVGKTNRILALFMSIVRR